MLDVSQLRHKHIRTCPGIKWKKRKGVGEGGRNQKETQNILLNKNFTLVGWEN